MSRTQPSRSGATQQQQPHAPSSSQTTTEPAPQPQSQPQQRTLRLRGARNTNGRSVQWAEDVVDNEHLGRKSSKVCCIYHRPKAVDESSDESSSDSDISSGDEGGGDADRKGKGKGHKCGGPGHDHGKSDEKKSGRKPSPNAYEKVPKVKPKEETGRKG